MGSPERNISKTIELSLNSHQAEIVWDSLYEALHHQTRLEIRGELKKKGIEENRQLRGVVETLVTTLGKDKKDLDPHIWLAIGLTSFIPRDVLEQLANPDDPSSVDRETHAAAKYFLSH